MLAALDSQRRHSLTVALDDPAEDGLYFVFTDALTQWASDQRFEAQDSDRPEALIAWPKPLSGSSPASRTPGRPADLAGKGLLLIMKPDPFDAAFAPTGGGTVHIRLPGFTGENARLWAEFAIWCAAT